MSEWIDWTGGEIPVYGSTRVAVRWKSGEIMTNRASKFVWSRNGFADDVVAYKILDEEPKGHQNASILMEIAKEAAINTEYWKEFQWQRNNGDWVNCTSENNILTSVFNENLPRRKPRTIRIGNYDVPELFVRLYTEVKGLSFGTDWNKGTHAKHHREAILECVKLIGDVHDDAMKEFMAVKK